MVAQPCRPRTAGTRRHSIEDDPPLHPHRRARRRGARSRGGRLGAVALRPPARRDQGEQDHQARRRLLRVLPDRRCRRQVGHRRGDRPRPCAGAHPGREVRADHRQQPAGHADRPGHRPLRPFHRPAAVDQAARGALRHRHLDDQQARLHRAHRLGPKDGEAGGPVRHEHALRRRVQPGALCAEGQRALCRRRPAGAQAGAAARSERDGAGRPVRTRRRGIDAALGSALPAVAKPRQVPCADRPDRCAGRAEPGLRREKGIGPVAGAAGRSEAALGLGRVRPDPGQVGSERSHRAGAPPEPFLGQPNPRTR